LADSFRELDNYLRLPFNNLRELPLGRKKQFPQVKRGVSNLFKGWEKVRIKTKSGIQEAVAPVIISASRSTDIPAFYGDWFIKRWCAGYSKWINPFNQRVQYISFAKTRVIVFWTKNPQPFLKYLPVLDQTGVNYYFTFTVNDYEAEGLEPNLPSLEKRIETFKRLSEILGYERVIWRFDPLILSTKLNVERLLEKISRVGEELYNYTGKLVISFADISVYKKVRCNLAQFIDWREFDIQSMIKIARGLQNLNKNWGLTITSCGEEIDLSEYGIYHNRCIDDELMIKLFPYDQVLMEFLGNQEPDGQGNLFPLEGKKMVPKYRQLKDKGQRKACGCIVSKDIGQYNTCMHLCRYCYANYSEKVVRANYARRTEEESII
jgi:DNA repair photolyase